MKKTNRERAKSVLKWNAVKSSWENDDHRRLTVNGVDLLKDITAALDKAERRERRKGSVFYEVKPRPAQQFDAEKVRTLISDYGEEKRRDGRGLSNNSILVDLKSYRLYREILTELGIEQY